MVLGFSMGANQARAAREREFDQVAYIGMRPAMAKILASLGLELGQSIDSSMTRFSKRVGYSSISRCSLEMWEKGSWKTSGTIMTKATTDPWSNSILERCVQTYLPSMPFTAKVVVLLGSSPVYINGIIKLIRKTFPDFAYINEVAFKADGRTWVFVVHPKAQGNQVTDWLTGLATSVAGAKRGLAITAVSAALKAKVDAAPSSLIGLRRLVKRTPVVA
ncbi:hypothetical protein DT603_03325 [Pseudoxanthomonas gei]|uniref:RNase H type-1 domain-containing protein n=1 Tax=Pseudoxanthomonas gei TaxID=1383030 RepID=A0ABX0AFB7_9GAMM|nr:hypothetical protein [Pseudoxanthomonas gei]NDK37868.1 hypothetical protein [Pseudoxanthomonas gei]